MISTYLNVHLPLKLWPLWGSFWLLSTLCKALHIVNAQQMLSISGWIMAPVISASIFSAPLASCVYMVITYISLENCWTSYRSHFFTCHTPRVSLTHTWSLLASSSLKPPWLDASTLIWKTEICLNDCQPWLWRILVISWKKERMSFSSQCLLRHLAECMVTKWMCVRIN